jgi:hypothetical protein
VATSPLSITSGRLCRPVGNQLYFVIALCTALILLNVIVVAS